MDGKSHSPVPACVGFGEVDRVYEKALGMTEIRRMGPEDGSCNQRVHGQRRLGLPIELTWNRGRTEPYDNGGRDSHLAFTVDDYEAARALHERWAAFAT